MLKNNLQNNSEVISDDNSPTKEDVLETLDFEINRISTEQQRNGWTKWALYGVLAGSLWLLLEQWEKGNFNFWVVLLLVLVFSVGIDIMRHSRRLLPHRPSRYERVLRFKFPTEIENGAAFFLYAIRHIVVFVIALLFVNKVSWSQATVIIVFYGLFSLFALIAVALFYYPEFEVIHNSKSKASLKSYYSFWTLTIIALIWGLIGYLNAALSYYPEGISLANFRIAGLLVVTAYTFYLLIDLSKNIPLLSVLTEIRRELSFGRIDLQTAIKQAEIGIAGISVDERLQEDIRAVMPLLERRNLEFNQICDKITAFSKEFPKQISDITKEEEKKAKETLLPCLDEINELLKKDEEVEKLKRKFRVHISLVERESPESVKSAKDFLEKIEDSETEMENKAEAMFSEFLPTVERLQIVKKRLANEKV